MSSNPKLRLFASLAAVVIVLAGCAFARSKGTLLEPRVITKDERVMILWDIGNFEPSKILSDLQRSNVFGKRYELCINDFFEKTFLNNGYKVTAQKVPVARFDSSSTTAQYILVLHNFGALGEATKPSVFLRTRGGLYDQRTGKLIWSVENNMSSFIDDNAIPMVQLVRAMAADGLLTVKLEQVADYDGVVSPQFRNISGCKLR